MIEKLTKAQEKKLVKYRDEWTSIGLDTKPADRPVSEKAIRAAYESGALKAPKHIFWAESPIAGAKMAAFIRKNERLPDNDLELESLQKSEITSELSCAIFGQHDAAWLGFYEFFDKELKLEATKKLRPLAKFARNCGWAFVYENVAILVERPCRLSRDAEGRLHNTTEAAVLYPDGWGVYSVGGVRVPKDIILDRSSITAERIDTEPNAEVRRVMLELFGLEKYVASLTPVQSDKFGKLYKRTHQGDEDLVVVAVKNSTPEPDGSIKDYFLRVPPTITSAKEGVAWTFGLTSKDYEPEIET